MAKSATVIRPTSRGYGSSWSSRVPVKLPATSSGMPIMALPTATPKSRVATAEPPKKSQSQNLRQPSAFDLGTELHRHGAGDQRRQQQHESGVEAREDGGIGLWEGGEEGAAEGHQPHLVAVPDGTDGVDGDAPLLVGPRHERVQDADAEIEAVEDGVADEQHALERRTR